MTTLAVKYIPKGYHTVTPYLTVTGVEKLIDFVKAVFGAEELYRGRRPNGSIGHASVKLGDSVVEMAEANAQWKPMPCSLHIYVPDVDACYKKALLAGATSLHEPADQFYGERSAGVKDSSGNHWYIATHKEDLTPVELARREKEFFAKNPQ